MLPHMPSCPPVPMATVADLARVLRIAECTARDHCHRGLIKGAVRIGRAWRIPHYVLVDLSAGKNSKP